MCAGQRSVLSNQNYCSSRPSRKAGFCCIMRCICSSVAPHLLTIRFANFSSPSKGGIYTACPISESTTMRSYPTLSKTSFAISKLR